MSEREAALVLAQKSKLQNHLHARRAITKGEHQDELVRMANDVTAPEVNCESASLLLNDGRSGMRVAKHV